MALVRIEADDGSVGWGEAKAAVGSAGSCATLVACINDELGPGADRPRRHAGSTRPPTACYNGPRAGYAPVRGRTFPILGRRGLTVSAMSGVDMALWDLLGRSLGVPVVDLWGGPCRPDMPLYASGGWADVDGIGAELGKYVAAGFGAVKMRVGVIDGTVEASVARVAAAREALGPGGRADGRCPRHVQRRRGQAVRRRRRAARRALVRGAGQRRRPSGDGRGAGVDARGDRRRRERVHPLRLPRPRRAIGAVDVLQPDLAICGGPTEGRRIAALAETHQLELAPHCWGSALSFAAGREPRLRQPGGHRDRVLARAPTRCSTISPTSPITVENGRVAAPAAPGLGVTPRPEFIDEFTVRRK